MLQLARFVIECLDFLRTCSRTTSYQRIVMVANGNLTGLCSGPLRTVLCICTYGQMPCNCMQRTCAAYVYLCVVEVVWSVLSYSLASSICVCVDVSITNFRIHDNLVGRCHSFALCQLLLLLFAAGQGLPSFTFQTSNFKYFFIFLCFTQKLHSPVYAKVTGILASSRVFCGFWCCMRLALLLGSARGCPGSTCISPCGWIDR